MNLRTWVDSIYRTLVEVNTAVPQKVGLMQREIFQMDVPDVIDEIELEPPAHVAHMINMEVPKLFKAEVLGFLG